MTKLILAFRTFANVPKKCIGRRQIPGWMKHFNICCSRNLKEINLQWKVRYNRLMATLKGFNNDQRYFVERWARNVCQQETWSWFIYNRCTSVALLFTAENARTRPSSQSAAFSAGSWVHTVAKQRRGGQETGVRLPGKAPLSTPSFPL
jgi:hypothetical protein